MKIEKLFIYGFGEHENVTMDFGSGINVLYGLNEAGKTTIQQFILSILFGFPQRNSMFLRYEPKSGGKYGGQIQLIDNVYGSCTVERVRGKSAGDVTVYFQDGRRGGEEELKILLRQYDRGSFESIFSFSLLQLQGFEKMDEEELSRTLLASGTTGVDSLLQLEKKMEKLMSDLFKKSGRNPQMNAKMTELRELESELKIEQAKVEEYAPSIKRIIEIDNKLLTLRETEKRLKKDVQKYTLLRQLLPLQRKKEGLENQLLDFSTVKFPSDGIRRLESLSGKIKETTATKRRIEEEMSEMVTHMPDKIEVNRLTEIELLLSKESEWHVWRTTLKAMLDDVRRLEGLKKRLLDRLGVKDEETETKLHMSDVSLQMEEVMYALIDEITDCDNQISFAESELKNAETEHDETKLKLDSNEQTKPTDEELIRVKEWPENRTKLAEAKAYVSLGEKKVTTRVFTIPVVLLLIAFGFIVVGYIQKEWFIFFAGLILGGAGAFLYLKKVSDSVGNTRLQEMLKFIHAHEGKETELELLRARFDLYVGEKGRLQATLVTLEQKNKTIKSKLDMLYLKKRQANSSLTEFLGNYGFNGLPSPGIVPELFRMIRDVQEAVRDIKENAKDKNLLEISIEERTKEAEDLLQKVVPSEAIYEMLRREYIRLKEEAETANSLNSRMEKLKPRLIEMTLFLDSLVESLRTLLDEAGVENEAEFYDAYDAHQEKLLIKSQLEDADAQLAANGPLNLRAEMTDVELTQQGYSAENERSLISEELDVLINEKATLVNLTKLLLSDKTYGQKLQLFEFKRAELGELAKKWSESKAIAEAIRRIMSELKEKKLPEVLSNAEEIFTHLTSGKYESLVVTEDGYFEAISADGMRYPIVELSQATKEQAYISLRLALAESVISSAPFPIIMDDPFVHFDGERLSRMIEVISKLQNRHQVIYFTCHKNMMDKWTDAIVNNIATIGNEQGELIL